MLCVFLHKSKLGRLSFLEHAALNDLIDARARKRKTRVETALNLREIIANDKSDFIDGLLARDHHPHATAATRAEFFDDALQVQHKALVVADELPHFVGHEQQAELATVLSRARFAIIVDLLGKRVDGNNVVFFAIKPA